MSLSWRLVGVWMQLPQRDERGEAEAASTSPATISGPCQELGSRLEPFHGDKAGGWEGGGSCRGPCSARPPRAMGFPTFPPAMHVITANPSPQEL